MKISEHWLREFIDPPASAREMAERLTLVGLEVAGVEDAVPAFEGVVVAKVQSVEPHPAADKLKLCRVAAGGGEMLQIVCGASNVRAGMTSALVQAGGHLPGGKTIHASKLRGVESQGMLCSSRELGLSDDHSGIMDLPADLAAGQPLLDALGGADKVLDIEITPNRGDALSVLGIARELGAIYDMDVHVPESQPAPVAITERLPIAIDAHEACPVFAGRIVRGLRTNAGTPLWMAERLRRAGLRSVSPLVDVTQYVMLEFGQPMHAYDLAKIRGTLRVRWATDGEHLLLLNGSDITLAPDMLVIADDSGAVGLAGVMGGQGTAVSNATTDIFLESAGFAPRAVQGRARRLGLTTDAGYRFERGVDPQGQTRALERATHLLREITGGEAGQVTATNVSPKASEPALDLRALRLKRLLGIDVPANAAGRILKRLGFRPQKNSTGWRVTVPTWRFDIELEEDLVEEVGRVYGYDNVPPERSPSRSTMAAAPEERVPVERLRDILVDRGYQEIITYSFVDGALQRLLTGMPGARLANPISDQMGELRTSLWPGLIQALRYNLNRQQTRVRLFETGNRYIPYPTEIKEEFCVSGLISGLQDPIQWGSPQRSGDFFDLRGDIEALLPATAGVTRLEAIADRQPSLQPGQTARLRLAGADVGWMGSVHPAILNKLGIAQSVLLFELTLQPLLRRALPRVADIPRFPAVQRDLSVLVPDEVSAGRLMEATRAAAGPQLADLRVFDVYRGKGIDSGRKSVALSLIFQDYSRTLIDSEADELMSGITLYLQRELGVTIRD